MQRVGFREELAAKSYDEKASLPRDKIGTKGRIGGREGLSNQIHGKNT